MKSEQTDKKTIYPVFILVTYLTLSLIGLVIIGNQPVEATKSNQIMAPTPSMDGMEASKSVAPGRVFVGDTLTYTIKMTNTGVSPIASVLMTDILPSEVIFGGYLDASNGNTDESNGMITWSGSIPTLETIAITFTSQVTSALVASASFLNTAEIFDGSILHQASVMATAVVTSEVYLPLVMRDYPPITLLNSIPVPESHAYTITWAAVSHPIDKYVLQESTRSNFGTISDQWETTETEQVIQKAVIQGKFYYRVRADNENQWGEGQWSNTRWFYFDDFTNSNSGWVVSDNNKRLYEYLNGEYRLLAKKVGELYSTIHPGDGYQNYMVEADVRWVGETTGGWYGLIFGVNSNYDQYYAFVVVVDSQDFALLRRQTNGEFVPIAGLINSAAINTSQQTNHLGIIRNGNKVTLTANDVNLGTWTDGTILGTTYSGIIAGSVGVNSVDARFDNFYLSDYVQSNRNNDYTPQEIKGLDINKPAISDPISVSLFRP